MLPATPQRTADSRLVAPTPMIAAVMVCVVEIGRAEDERGDVEDERGRRLGGEAVRRVELDDPAAERAHDPPAAGVRAGRDRGGRREHDPQRDVGRRSW